MSTTAYELFDHQISESSVGRHMADQGGWPSNNVQDLRIPIFARARFMGIWFSSRRSFTAMGSDTSRYRHYRDSYASEISLR